MKLLVRTVGSTEETAWEETDRTILVVGQEPSRTRQVKVVWVGAPGATLGVRVDFRVSRPEGEDETAATFLRAGETEKTVVLPLDPEGKLAYRYEVRRITPAGEEPARAGEGQTSLLVVQS